MASSQHKGQIIHCDGRTPWPHELRTAKILANAGYTVKFLPENNGLRSPDILLDSMEYEMKSPETAKISSLEQSIRTALKQSSNIIVDSHRMKMHDTKVRNFLVKKCREQKTIKNILFVTKKGRIIDIRNLIR